MFNKKNILKKITKNNNFKISISKIFDPIAVEFINDFSFESVIKIPPPKLSFLPLITTSPSFPPIIQGDLEIIKALFIIKIFCPGFIITL